MFCQHTLGPRHRGKEERDLSQSAEKLMAVSAITLCSGIHFCTLSVMPSISLAFFKKPFL